jgi:hypothetical protein
MTQNDAESAQFAASLQYVQDHAAPEAKKRAPELMGVLGHHFFALRESPLMTGVDIYLNEAVLAHACNAFYADIFRIEAFHSVHYAADDHKKAAHIFKWISRLRPIYPNRDNPHGLKGAAIIANSMFAMLCACTFLKISAFTPTPNEREHINYSSIYRDIHPQEWSMTFYLLEKLYAETGGGLVAHIQQFLDRNRVLTLSDKADFAVRLKTLPADATKGLLLKLMDLGFENESKALQLIKDYIPPYSPR